jgi:hypothetical protein
MRKLLAVLTPLLVGLALPSVAGASKPETTTFTTQVVFPDFFAGLDSPHCDFKVVGTWTATGRVTTFTARDGSFRVVSHVSFSGTLSNPNNGKSIPDAGIIVATDYFTADGTFIKDVDHNTRFNKLFHVAFRAVTDASGQIVFDKGRDWLFENKHPIPIQPVCDALS